MPQSCFAPVITLPQICTSRKSLVCAHRLTCRKVVLLSYSTSPWPVSTGLCYSYASQLCHCSLHWPVLKGSAVESCFPIDTTSHGPVLTLAGFWQRYCPWYVSLFPVPIHRVHRYYQSKRWQTRTPTHTDTRRDTDIQTHTHTRTHARAHTHTHTHTHTTPHHTHTPPD